MTWVTSTAFARNRTLIPPVDRDSRAPAGLPIPEP